MFGGTNRNPIQHIPKARINNKKRNLLIENEKMSKLFTKKRRITAKTDFQDRVQMNLIKKKQKMKDLENKFYNFSFKPKTNRKKTSKIKKKEEVIQFSEREIIKNETLNLNLTQSMKSKEENNFNDGLDCQVRQNIGNIGICNKTLDMDNVMSFNPNLEKISFENNEKVFEDYDFEENNEFENCDLEKNIDGHQSPGFPLF